MSKVQVSGYIEKELMIELDRRATNLGLSRANYIKILIVNDLKSNLTLESLDKKVRSLEAWKEQLTGD